MATTPLHFDQTLPDEVYGSLLRSLRRRRGFGLMFVQCTPVRATQLMEDVERDLPQKTMGVLSLSEPVDTLYDLITQRSDLSNLNILFITGLGKSLEADIKPGYGGEGDYYNLDTVPPILAHLNQQRERFRENFSNLCFIFLLPPYAIKYLIRRAPDFFDWGTGVFELPTDRDTVERESSRLFGNYEEYLTWTQQERDRQILKIQTWLAESSHDAEHQASLFKEQGNLFYASNRVEEAIASYDKAIASKLDMHQAWSNRGLVLSVLGRYEEAIASYDKAIEAKPDDNEAWYNRGNSLNALGRHEEAIASYDKAIEAKPDDNEAWSNRGVALDALGRHDEAIASYDEAIEIKPDDANAYYNKACCLSLMSDRNESIKLLATAITLDSSCRESAQKDEDFAELRNDAGFKILVE